MPEFAFLIIELMFLGAIGRAHPLKADKNLEEASEVLLCLMGDYALSYLWAVIQECRGYRSDLLCL